MPSNGKPNRVTPDQYVRERVVTDDLAGVLRRWLQDYEAIRPSKAKIPKWATGTRSFESPIEHLTRLTATSQRRIWAIINVQTRTTSLWLADRLLTAIGEEYMLRTGEIRILEDFRANSAFGKTDAEWAAFLEERGIGQPYRSL